MARRSYYCQRCRKSLGFSAFDWALWDDLNHQVCRVCVERLIQQGEAMDRLKERESEMVLQLIMQEREGGEREVETPIGYVDLLTDEEVIEVKHISAWKEAIKVVLYAAYFPTRKPRIHLFGGYTADTRKIVEETMQKFNVRVTWEREPF